MSERTMLLDHGTRAIDLKPSSLIAAASEDLRKFARNADRELAGECEHYAFHRAHVRKAAKQGSPGALISFAIAEVGRGQASGKHWTRVIYSNSELLAAAHDEFVAAETRADEQIIASQHEHEAALG